MKVFDIPYGKESLKLAVPKERLRAVLLSSIHAYKPDQTPAELISAAMGAPVGAPVLSELAVNKKKIVLIASDHTRPVPSRLIIPPMLEQIRSASPEADITLLIATGCHRETRRDELLAKFGPEIVDNEKIVIHDCDDADNLVSLGILPSGSECFINRLAYEADLLLAEGFIEPHFFAGYSGGRKSVLPGIAGRRTVLGNHCSEFIAHPNSRTGVLEGNLIHQDMLWAAKKAGLAYIVNVVIDQHKQPIYAVAGEPEAAHAQGCGFLSSLCRVSAEPADIVITSNGGYPLDQNIYQAVKGMTAAEAAVREGGVIIMAARSEDGHGGEQFFRQLSEEADIDKILAQFMSRDKDHTQPDQWQTQIMLRVLKKARVIYISQAPDELIRAMKMIPAHSMEEALAIADRLAGAQAGIAVIPDGVSVIVSC